MIVSSIHNIVLFYLLVLAVSTVIREVQQRIEAARMGAQLAPVANGWLPGNVDLMYKFVTGQKEKVYAGKSYVMNWWNMRLIECYDWKAWRLCRSSRDMAVS